MAGGRGDEVCAGTLTVESAVKLIQLICKSEVSAGNGVICVVDVAVAFVKRVLLSGWTFNKLSLF